MAWLDRFTKNEYLKYWYINEMKPNCKSKLLMLLS